jgi:DivIVA domain-containing protein
MRHWVLLLLLAVTVAVIAYLVVWVFTGNDDGLDPEEPDGRAVPLPGSRPLVESDISALRFDTVVRGYRMVQVDAALRRAAYDVGYKQELIDVLEAEVIALRDGRMDDAEALRQARDGAVGGTGTTVVTTLPVSAPRGEAADASQAGDASYSGDAAQAGESKLSVPPPGEPPPGVPKAIEPEVDAPREVESSPGATAEPDDAGAAESDRGKSNGAVDRIGYEDQALDDRAATGR